MQNLDVSCCVGNHHLENNGAKSLQPTWYNKNRVKEGGILLYFGNGLIEDF